MQWAAQGQWTDILRLRLEAQVELLCAHIDRSLAKQECVIGVEGERLRSGHSVFDLECSIRTAQSHLLVLVEQVLQRFRYVQPREFEQQVADATRPEDDTDAAVRAAEHVRDRVSLRIEGDRT